MLSPFKAFLSNLQKNAGATIFGLSSPVTHQSDENAASTASSTSTTGRATSDVPTDSTVDLTLDGDVSVEAETTATTDVLTDPYLDLTLDENGTVAATIVSTDVPADSCLDLILDEHGIEDGTIANSDEPTDSCLDLTLDEDDMVQAEAIATTVVPTDTCVDLTRDGDASLEAATITITGVSTNSCVDLTFDGSSSVEAVDIASPVVSCFELTFGEHGMAGAATIANPDEPDDSCVDSTFEDNITPTTVAANPAAVEFQQADDQLSQQSCDDPMSDPLALEDCLQFDESVAMLSTMPMVPAATAFATLDESMSDPNPSDSNEMAHDFIRFDVSAREGSVCVEEGGVRSDGSDSGLGLESTTSNSLRLAHDTCDTSIPSRTVQTVAATTSPQPLRTALKRRSDTSIPDVHVAFGDCLDRASASASASAKRAKRHIHFNDVTVFYFQRQQGFMCVPSQGGCSLGMAAQHMYRRRFTLAEYAAEQRRVQRHKAQMLKRSAGLPVSSSEDSAGGSDDEGEGDVVEGSQPVGGGSLQHGCTTVDAATLSDSDDNESMGIQPVSARQRRVLLKAAGVRKIDAAEKKECRDILLSRDNCGCDCRGFCDPETCACAQSGIKCQVDRLHYPCGCTRDGCGNTIGRAEFNKARVNTHYIHTFLRLQMESKTPPPPSLPPAPAPSAVAVHDQQQINEQQHMLPAVVSDGWHSQVGRSLAAMSGNNLYNMSGATTTITPASTVLASGASVHHDLMPLTLDQTPDLHYAYGGGDDIVFEMPVSALTGGALHNSLASSPFDCFAGTATAASSSSGLSTPTNLLCNGGGDGGSSMAASAFVVMSASTSASMYSPDSAKIVEPAATSTAVADGIIIPTAEHDDINVYNNHPPMYPAETVEPTSEAVETMFPEYGNNITGYQHSYLYSLQQQQQQQLLPETPEDQQTHVNGNSGSSSSINRPVGPNGYQHSYLYSLQQQRTEPTPSTSSVAAPASSSHQLLTPRDNGVLDLQNNIEYSDESIQSTPDQFNFEPIDFESELNLATTFIDKSLKTCVVPPGGVASLSTSGASATNGHHHYHSDSESG